MSEAAQQIIQRSLLGEAMDLLEGVAVFVWNEDRNYVAVNDEACRLVGLSRDELVGMPVGERTPGQAARELEQVRAGGGPTDGFSSFTRPDGEVVELQWTTVHTRIASLPYMVSICRRRT